MYTSSLLLSFSSPHMSSTVHSKNEQPILSHFFASFNSSDIPQGASANIRLPHALCGQGLGDGGHTQTGDTHTQTHVHTHTAAQKNTDKTKSTDLMDHRSSSRELGCIRLPLFLCLVSQWRSPVCLDVLI